MLLIEGIEIGYFRSIYKLRLDKLTGLTVLFGRNDSGKSNVLRALNLFFNGNTNPGQPFAFDRDLCHARMAEAEGSPGARKFAYVKIELRTPSSWVNSLGESFWVKKSWSITKQTEPNIESSIKESKKQQYLTRFLNKVRFHYIPAIKDRRIFEELLAQIYAVVATQEEFRSSLASFSQELRMRTADLSEGLLAQLTLQSVIAPPTDLIELFRSLDFETQSAQGDSYSLTLQRGDGIQVRHIPAILAFLSDRSAEDYHVWGFEEPENSLELANAIAEAQTFLTYSTHSNKQIFLTSHSPAFFALDMDAVQRFFVGNGARGDRKVSTVSAIGANNSALPGDLMGETPHLPVISQYLKEADTKIRQLSDYGAELERDLSSRDRSLLFLEGESDRTIIEAAWNRYVGSPMPFDIVAGQGTKKMESLAVDGRVLNRLAPQRRIYVLVDNDKEGRELLKNRRLDGGRCWIPHNSNSTTWCRLPWTDEFQRVLGGLGIPKHAWPGCLENIFSMDIRARALAAGAYAFKSTPYDELLNSEIYPRISTLVSNEQDPRRIYILRPDPDYKERFASWVVENLAHDPEIVAPLRETVESLSEMARDEPRANGETDN
jgi:hypothetical protein